MSERQNQISELILTPQGGASAGNVRENQISEMILTAQGTPIIGNVRQDNEFLLLLVPYVAGRVQLIQGGFQDAMGHPVALGKLTIKLSRDAESPTGELCADLVATLPLDSNGNISGTYYVWPNSLLQPSDTYYIAKVYTAEGQLVWLQNIIVPTTPSPFPIQDWEPVKIG